MDTKSNSDKDFFVKELVSLFTDSNIANTAAGGIFTFKYGKYIVDKYTPTELIEAAHNLDNSVKERYAAELNAAFLMYRYFKKHPNELELGKQKMDSRKEKKLILLVFLHYSIFLLSAQNLLCFWLVSQVQVKAALLGNWHKQVLQKICRKNMIPSL